MDRDERFVLRYGVYKLPLSGRTLGRHRAFDELRRDLRLLI